MATTRRNFCSQAATLLFTPRLLLAQAAPTSRPDVAAIDHDRILQSATHFLTQSPTPLTSLPCPRSPGTPHDFYSEAEDYWPDPANLTGPFVLRTTGEPNPNAFTAHRDALLNFSICVPALTASFVLTNESRYAQHAIAHLKAWFIDPATSMTPSLLYGQTIPPAKAGRPEGVIEAVHLAEVVQCVPFLNNSEALTESDRTVLQKWFAEYFSWLNTSRLAGLARDTRNHLGSSWLLQAAAIAHLTSINDDAPLTVLRHQFKSSTIRAQIVADGTFPRELTTPNPYRNTLFNLDMLAGICASSLHSISRASGTMSFRTGPACVPSSRASIPIFLIAGRGPFLRIRSTSLTCRFARPACSLLRVLTTGRSTPASGRP